MDGLEPLKSFITPGGTPLSAALHVARTVIRRAERIAVELASVETDTSPEAIRYLNRLSGPAVRAWSRCQWQRRQDVLWVPGNHGDVKKGG